MIGRNRTRSKTKGLHLHLTLPVTSEGLPLGVLRCGFGTPPKADGGKSRRWINGLHFLRDYARECGVEAPHNLSAAMRLVARFGGTGAGGRTARRATRRSGEATTS